MVGGVPEVGACGTCQYGLQRSTTGVAGVYLEATIVLQCSLSLYVPFHPNPMHRQRQYISKDESINNYKCANIPSDISLPVLDALSYNIS